MKRYIDKLFHFLLSGFIVALLMIITGDIVLPIIITVLIGICKEMYDEFSEGGTGADWWDFRADVLGTLTGVLLVITM